MRMMLSRYIFIAVIGICACGTLQAQTAQIEAGATLDIRVAGEPHLDATVVVSPDGSIQYWRFGSIDVGGLSPMAAARIIAERIREYYPFLDNPQVSVSIKDRQSSSQLSFSEDTAGQKPSSFFGRTRGDVKQDLKPTYRISPFDTLTISVFGEKDLDKTVRVSESGTIVYPLIGEVYVQDLTAEEAVHKIEKLLEENYFVNPQVSLFIVEYAKFSVLGEVNRPGTFELKGALTLVDALVLAEGPKDSADLHQVKVIRTLRGKTEKIEEYFVDFETEGRAFYLKPLDRVIVQPKGKIYILGAVQSPGMYYLTEKEISLSDALSFLANGLTVSADPSSIEVVRKENGKDKSYIVNLDTEGFDFLLKAQDRIVVSEYGTISIFGQVKQPGRHPFKKGLTVVDAIAMAGGFTDVAARNAVKVIRKQDGSDKAIKVPVGYILSSGDTSRDIELHDGDSIVVPESWF